MTQASICTIGDEILIGQIVDTNSSRISQALNSLGIRVTRMLSIGDDHQTIVRALEGELERNEIVIVTGGLGPTKDDITKKALADLSGAMGWKTDERQLEIIRHILSARGIEALDINLAQASVPDTCEVIPNRKGTAPVMVFRYPEERFGHKASLYSLPGVPFEAIGALEDILTDIKAHHTVTDIYHKTIMTFGLPESVLAKTIENWEDSLPSDMHLAYLPNPVTGVRLRLSIYGGVREEEEKRIEAEIARLRPILGEAMYSDHDDTLQECIGRLLRQTGKTVSAAESCTGGTISALFTGIAGSSEYYLGSVTSYANSVKTGVLGVSPEIIETHGAVSSECVAAMAEGVRKLTGSDYSVATSGIAGPGGGSDSKPVGLVWIGVSSEAGTETFSCTFKGDRKRNMERFASSALDILRRKILRESIN
ncbi:MAG: CinA family nicotinamide mononucleotide deamidase-related protein [Bacteroidales bacterium]|nr:CinA family nicotinamide mononucleotide deamidase-related protein [Bacteroidales bacterium]MBQ9723014.1 CinA family nicotinamide mononucleotide deamidase-related protein [Bacteroidales bacterium]